MSGTLPTDNSHRSPSREMMDEVLEDMMWEEARPWEERWETPKVDEGRVEEQEVDDEDRHRTDLQSMKKSIRSIFWN